MSRPEKVSIGYETIPIRYVDHIADDYFGKYVETTNELLISTRYGRTRATLWHELLHVFSSQRGMGLSERQVGALEHAIMDFIRQNPDVAEYLIRRDKDDE